MIIQENFDISIIFSCNFLSYGLDSIYNVWDISLKAEHILDMDETEERYLYGPPIFNLDFQGFFFFKIIPLLVNVQVFAEFFEP